MFVSTEEFLADPYKVWADLKYADYAYTRDHSHFTPDQWRLVFGNEVDWLEARYQQEISDAGNVE